MLIFLLVLDSWVQNWKTLLMVETDNLDISQSASFRPFFSNFHMRKQQMVHIVDEVVHDMHASLLYVTCFTS